MLFISFHGILVAPAASDQLQIPLTFVMTSLSFKCHLGDVASDH